MRPGGRVSIGVDVGGTFTDLVAVDEDGRTTARKVLSTPADQAAAILDALGALGIAPTDVERIVHGTTIATNMLLERTGARVVLCATGGATDLLALRRQDRAALYDLARQHPSPLVCDGAAIPVRERVEPQGIVVPLTSEMADDAARHAAREQPEVVAVALLHAYASDEHERRLAGALRATLPDEVEVVCSHEVLPEIREFERTATTVAEAYLRPGVARYLRSLEERLGERGFPAPAVMTSSGGMRSAKDAARAAASLALSGPAGGMSGAAAIAARTGIMQALTIDIGGTSADVGLIVDGAALAEPGGEIAGVPIALPRVLVETVSAGGGSVAWCDEGGALRVGPRSAGAVPGPAAFGRGGREATVTDAHVVLGNLDARAMSAGLTLDLDAARRAVAALAARLAAPLERTAAAIVTVADAAMARALRRVSVERGIDPRACALIAFGGGGPLHACGLAELLGATRVFVPPHAGVLSALGLAIAPDVQEAMTSIMLRTEAIDADTITIVMQRLAARAGGAPHRDWWARARFAGQGHELDVTMAPGDDGAALAVRFREQHRLRFGFVLDQPVEVISARHRATGPSPMLTLADDEPRPAQRGPVTIALPDATLLVARDWTAHGAAGGGWMLMRDAPPGVGP